MCAVMEQKRRTSGHYDEEETVSERDRIRRKRRSRSASPRPLSEWKRGMTGWDVPPEGHETISVAQMKNMGLFPHPLSMLTGSGDATLIALMRPARMIPYGNEEHVRYKEMAKKERDKERLLQKEEQQHAKEHEQPSTAVTEGMHIHPGRRMDSGMMLSSLPTGGGIDPTVTANQLKQARRLYVGNIPFGMSEGEVADFFNQAFIQSGLVKQMGLPVVAVQIHADKNFAFIEMRTPEEATNALALDGIPFRGQILKMRRPKDYVPLPGIPSEPPSIHVPGVISTNVPDTPNKIFVGGLPSHVTEDQVKELLKAFGELKGFNLVKDTQTGLSKGYAFCEYVDPNITDIVCAGLNNMPLGDKRLVIQRASVGSAASTFKLGFPLSSSTNAIDFLASLQGVLTGGEHNGTLTGTEQQQQSPTRILVLMNMVTVDELVDDQEYEDIYEDVMEECRKYGQLAHLLIPRPHKHDDHENDTTTTSPDVPGLGKIIVEYVTVEEAQQAQQALSGRIFANHTVMTTYLTEHDYTHHIY